ncbi:MAG: hypothetical protein WD314_16405 [Trueperaceae bacterium]
MPELDPQFAVLAGELALATSRLSVVCVGCPVVGWGEQPPPLALVPPPFDALPLRSDKLQLVVASSGGVGFDLVVRCARANVKEVWLLRTAEGLFERLSAPAAGRYRRRSLVLPGESVTLAALPSVRITPLQRTSRMR